LENIPYYLSTTTFRHNTCMKKIPPTISELYPELNDEDLKEAEKNLKRYADLVLRMYRRITSDPVAAQELEKLTESDSTDTISGNPPEKSSP